jgi:nitrite reductase/ring-hydroxylating ferredoxin subunit
VDLQDEDGWTTVLRASDLPEGKAVRVDVHGVDVFLYRTPDRIFALANRCNHQGGPLHRGVVRATGANPSVTCPVHGSMFRLTDGMVIRGPARAPQHVYEARVSDDSVQVRSGAGTADPAG